MLVTGSGSRNARQPSYKAYTPGDAQPKIAIDQAGPYLQAGPGGSTAPDSHLIRYAPVGSATNGTFGALGPGLQNFRFARLGFFNVKDFGAIGDGTTDDWAAITAAIAEAAAIGRGTVFFPTGTYAVSQSIVLPNNKTIELVGAGHFLGDSGAVPGVRIQRTAGFTTADIIKNSQSVGSGESTRFCGAIRNIQFYNGTNTDRVALFNRTNHAVWDRVEFLGSGTGGNAGTELRGLWNSHFLHCKWHRCGTSSAAVMYVGDGLDGSHANTAHWVSCEWEVNTGRDIYLDSPSNFAEGCLFSNCKIENVIDGVHPMPLVVINKGYHNSFIGCMFFLGVNNDAPMIANNSTGVRNTIMGCSFERHAPPSGGNGYMIHQLGGSLVVTGCMFSNFASNVTAWRIDSGTAAPSGTFNTAGWNPGGAVGAANFYYDYTASKRFSDARSGGTGPGPQINV